MSFYRDRLLPRFLNRIMDRESLRVVRQRVCGDLRGDVIEIGFGSGLNIPHYPQAVAGVWAVDPAELGVRLASGRMAESSVTVHPAGLDGSRLDFADDRFDCALSTWTLCTIPDVGTALTELRRVLKPGGTFFFAEHGEADDRGVRRWQERLRAVNAAVGGGCQLNRPIGDLIERAGFEILRLDTYYAEGQPRPFGYTFEGVARLA
ncbi:MAG: hypothetical protein JJLCMIEE_02551 [Acidimicrobiales bacterium]|nr:MAG: class I SAM-dependent methyltransferase [Actinomycetota bacterium]MBV6509460.1 hypothetical protein [Acidimicrobiales bacterium]RIK06775.1 MAG: SAM-dependent methyltransferase [Acidobacteriota bacterium]